MSVRYEWSAEQVDEHGDIIDNDFADTLQELRLRTPDGDGWMIVLVKDDDAGRSWAYVEGEKLPDQFEDAYGSPCGKVPKRFHKELGGRG